LHASSAGQSGIAVLDDSNLNGKMDLNFIGFTKSYGSSNDARATLSSPSFQAASFSYHAESWLTVTIDVVY
jgi:uncharacterized protein (DUF2141 family)